MSNLPQVHIFRNDLRWYRSHNSNTMKNGRNPETREVIDELKRVDPLTVTLDPSVYDYVPEAAAEPAETPEKDNTPLYITFGVIAAALIAVLAFRKTKKA